MIREQRPRGGTLLGPGGWTVHVESLHRETLSEIRNLKLTNQIAPFCSNIFRTPAYFACFVCVLKSERVKQTYKTGNVTKVLLLW